MKRAKILGVLLILGAVFLTGCDLKQNEPDKQVKKAKEKIVTKEVKKESVKILTEKEIKNTKDTDILSTYEYENKNATGGEVQNVTLILYNNNVVDINAGDGMSQMDGFRGSYTEDGNKLKITRMFYGYNNNGTIEWIDGEQEMNNLGIQKTEVFEISADKSTLTCNNYLKGSREENGYKVKLIKK